MIHTFMESAMNNVAVAMSCKLSPPIHHHTSAAVHSHYGTTAVPNNATQSGVGHAANAYGIHPGPPTHHHHQSSYAPSTRDFLLRSRDTVNGGAPLAAATTSSHLDGTATVSSGMFTNGTNQNSGVSMTPNVGMGPGNDHTASAAAAAAAAVFFPGALDHINGNHHHHARHHHALSLSGDVYGRSSTDAFGHHYTHHPLNHQGIISGSRTTGSDVHHHVSSHHMNHVPLSSYGAAAAAHHHHVHAAAAAAAAAAVQ